MIIQFKKKAISSTKGIDSRLYSEMLRFSGTNPSILHETKVKVGDNQSKNKQTLIGLTWILYRILFTPRWMKWRYRFYQLCIIDLQLNIHPRILYTEFPNNNKAQKYFIFR